MRRKIWCENFLYRFCTRCLLLVLQTRTLNIWTIELSSGIVSRMTYHPVNDVAPLWSPDGRELVFSSDRKVRTKFSLYRKALPARKRSRSYSNQVSLQRSQ